MVCVVDTNILVYRFDPRYAQKQRIATAILRRGAIEDSVRIPHQAILEFVAAVSGLSLNDRPLLAPPEARREAEELLAQFKILYPNEAVVRMALRGAAAYQLSWFDANIWAYAEHYDIRLLLSEDFQHDRFYGIVRTLNPFL